MHICETVEYKNRVKCRYTLQLDKSSNSVPACLLFCIHLLCLDGFNVMIHGSKKGLQELKKEHAKYEGLTIFK